MAAVWVQMSWGGGGVWEEATSEDGVRCAVCAMELEDQQEQ